MEKFKTLDIVPSYKRKIGIIHRDWGPCDCAFYGISYGNKIVSQTNIDLIYFYENLPQFVIPPISGSMNIQDIWGFDGLTIATNLDSAFALSKVIGNHPKVFYVYDLEFLRPQNRNFLYNTSIYRNPNLKLVCRSDEHAKCLSNYSNRTDISIIDDFNLFEFWKQFGEDYARK